MSEHNKQNLESNDVSLLNRFKLKADEFMLSLDKLNAISNVPPNLQNDYSNLKLVADSVQGTISWITSTVDSVTGFFSDFFNFDGVSGTRDYINNTNPQQLGLIPLVPIAMITAAIAAMSKFIADVYVFERKINEQKRLEATGISPKEAAQIVDKISGKNFVQSLTALAKPVGFALSILLLTKIAKNYTK